MTRLLTHGDESGDSPNPTITGSVSDVGSPVNSGALAWQPAASNGAQNYATWSVSGVLDRTYYLRFYLYVTGYPATANRVCVEFKNTTPARASDLLMKPTGELYITDKDGNQKGSASSALSQNTWHLIELAVKAATATGLNGSVALRVDGVDIVTTTASNNNQVAIGSVLIGKIGNANWVTPTFDDVALNDDQGGSDNGYPGAVSGATPATIPLDASAAVSSTTLAASAQTQVSLGTSAAVAAPTLSLKAQTAIPLAASAAVASATLALKATTQVPLAASAGQSASTLAASATTGIPLNASAGLSISALSLKAETVIVLGVVSATSTATLVVTADTNAQPVEVLFNASAGTSSATFALKAPAGVSLDSALATAAAILSVSAQTTVALSASAATSTATAAVTIFSSDRPWTYDETPTATYGGSASMSYDRSDDWSYEPVT